MNKVTYTIDINGKEFIINESTTLTQLIEKLDLGKKSFALAVNGEVIKKEKFESFKILPHSKIEIISAVGGG